MPGFGLLTAGLLLFLIPLIEGEQDGWPAWCLACFGGCVVVFTLLAVWELAAQRRDGDPLLKPELLRQTSFSAGAIFAVTYFAGFSSVFWIAIIGTVLFGTLHLSSASGRPGPQAVARAFSHSAQLALLTNLAFVIISLILVVALPRRIPGHDQRETASS